MAQKTKTDKSIDSANNQAESWIRRQTLPANPNPGEEERTTAAARTDGARRFTQGQLWERAAIIGKFSLGAIEVRPGAEMKVPRGERFSFLLRHASGNWGDLDEFEWTLNDNALEYGGRLRSRYRTRQGTEFYVLTEPDRSVTAVLMPEEYQAAVGTLQKV